MKKIKNLISKNMGKRKKAVLVFLVLVCVLLAPTSFVSAGWFADVTIGNAMYGVMVLMSWLVSIAATIFGTVIDPQFVSGDQGILNKQAIKDIWIMVRDTLNMFFILVLLFAAFCTIFQVEKWNLKKVWWIVLIMALLVNFSYSIARFVIDISNVAFYYLVNNMFTSSGGVTGEKMMADFSATTMFQGMLEHESFTEQPLASELAIIIFLFILGVTLMVVAILFVVRLAALAMLIMFSPIGFVGYIFPETRKYATDWWNQLLSYSFFAPVMIFMVAVAIQVSRAVGTDNKASFTGHAINNVSDTGDTALIASAAFFSIPIIILWFGMGIAKKMSIAGAAMVTDKAQGWSKDLGKWMMAAPYRAAKWGVNQTGIPEGMKKGWEDARKKGKLFGKDVPLLKDRREERAAEYAGIITGGREGGEEALRKRREAERRESVKKQAEIEGMDAMEHEDLYKEIQTYRNMPPDKKAAMSEKEQIRAAALERTALSRGAQYSEFVEKYKVEPEMQKSKQQDEIKSRAEKIAGFVDPGTFKPPVSKIHAPPATASPAVLAKYQADVQAEHQRALEEHKEKVAKWEKAKEKAEKDMYKEIERLSQASAKSTISQAEKLK